MTGGRGSPWLRLLVPVLACGAVAACSGTSPSPTPAALAAPGPSTAGASPSPTLTRIGNATAAPSWLGTRVLPVGANGFATPGDTPPELVNRSIISTDDLPPPPDGAFHSTIGPVPPAVLARSTWTAACPVKATDLRYVTVSFRGFDGLPHTGELMVNAGAAPKIVQVFSNLFADAYPIERMVVPSEAELTAPPTGDGNTTAAFACRPVRGQKTWSQHAYGLAVDVNPFQNPYHKADVVLPELATSYLTRGTVRPGMIEPHDRVIQAFAGIGWKWGGDYRSLKDYMHFSATGG